MAGWLDSDLVHLVRFDDGISLGNGISSSSLVIISATVLIRVAVQGAEGVAAAALEPREPHSFLAQEAPVCLRSAGGRVSC